MTTFAPEQATELLSHVWPANYNGWGEFRALTLEGGALRPSFIPTPVKKNHLALGLDWVARENAAKRNVYYGVNPRANPRGRNQDVAVYSSFIADLDDVDTSWPEVAKLATAGAPPSACV